MGKENQPNLDCIACGCLDITYAICLGVKLSTHALSSGVKFASSPWVAGVMGG